MPVPSADSPSLAMVIVVRNEQRFLAGNLLYHHSQGVAKAYVFLDRCTDATEEICQRFPWVQAFHVDSTLATEIRQNAGSVTSASNWRDKYAQLSTDSAIWHDGTAVKFPRQAWKEASVRLSDAESTTYFRRWVAMSEEQLQALTATGQVVQEQTIEQVLQLAGCLNADSLQLPDLRRHGEPPTRFQLASTPNASPTAEQLTLSMA